MQQLFSSRFALVLAALGMAIGTGNIWRFPRIAAEYEGGAFLIPWAIFLFTWSIPILIAEFTLGKVTQRGPIGAFSKLLGKQSAWMGAFIAFGTLMIASYYSVVTGWTLRYAFEAVTQLGESPSASWTAAQIESSHTTAKDAFGSFAESWSALGFHLISVALALFIVWRGIRGGVELATKVMVPLLFVLLIAGTVWALTTLQGAEKGLHYFFTPNWSLLTSPKIWIAALSQSAWSTGAGWGLILAYGAYARRNDDAVAVNHAGGLGNNTASLFAGMFLFPAVFALLSQAGYEQAQIVGALKDNGDGNTGLAFTYIPFIFSNLGAVGSYAKLGFFLGLFFAALSSLIAMYEMGVRTLLDCGLSRGRSGIIIGIVCAAIGSLAALDMKVFLTLDWVFGLGLIIGGVVIVRGGANFRAQRFREDLINRRGARRRMGPWFNTLFVFLLPAQGITLLLWWLYDAATNPGYFDPEGKGIQAWDPLVLGTFGVGPCVIWWLTLVGIFAYAAPWLGRISMHGEPDADVFEGGRPSPWKRLPLLLIAIVPWVLTSASSTLSKGLDDLLKQEMPWWALGAIILFVIMGGFVRWSLRAIRNDESSARDDHLSEDQDVHGV